MVLASLIAIELGMVDMCPCHLSLSSCPSTQADAYTAANSFYNDCPCGMKCCSQHQHSRDKSGQNQKNTGNGRVRLVQRLVVANAAVTDLMRDTAVGSPCHQPTSIYTLATLQLQRVRLQV
jgi:hypothetical protein